MKRSVIVASLLLNVLASDAFAATWSASGDVKQSVDTSNNYFLQPLPAGYAGKALSAIDLDFLAATPTTQYRLDTNYSYYHYFGPGDVDQKPLWGTPAGAKFRYNYNGALSQFTAGASWQRADVATTALEQTGQASGGGTVDTYAANGSWKYKLSPRDTITWTNNASTVSFSQPAGPNGSISQTPYFDYATSGAWAHRISPTISVIDSFDFDWHSQDDTAKTQRLLWDAKSSLSWLLTRRLTLNASVTGTLVHAYEKNPGALFATGLPAPTGLNSAAGTESALQWSAELKYSLSKKTTASLSAADVVTPTVFGQLQQTNSIGLTVVHNINLSSTLTAFAQLSRLQSTGSSPTQFFITSLKYEYRLPRNWVTDVTLTYRQRDRTGGGATSGLAAATPEATTATAGAIFVSFKHDFTLYGKPQPAPSIGPLTAGQLTSSGSALPNISSEPPVDLQPGTGLSPEQEYNPEQAAPAYPEQPEYNPETAPDYPERQPEYNPETAPDYPERQPEYNPEQPQPVPPTTNSPQD